MRNTGIAKYGLGRKLADGPKDLTTDEILTNGYYLLWWSTITYCCSLAFSKYTILAFYWRVFKLSSIRIPIQILAVLSVFWLLAQILLTTLQCIPTRAFWDLSLQATKCTVDESVFFFAQVLTHVIIDICILVLPVIQIGKMQLRLGQKIGVIGLFLVGLL